MSPRYFFAACERSQELSFGFCPGFHDERATASVGTAANNRDSLSESLGVSSPALATKMDKMLPTLPHPGWSI